MPLPILAAGGATAAGPSAAGAAAGSGAGGAVAAGSAAAGSGGAGGVASGSAATAASNFGLVGGALDSLGVSVTGWIDRANRKKAIKQEQANLDRQFEENQRIFGLQFALNEFSTRKNISMQEAQNAYNQQMGTLTTQSQLEMQAIGKKQQNIALKEQKRRQKLGQAFAKGFAKGTWGK